MNESKAKKSPFLSISKNKMKFRPGMLIRDISNSKIGRIHKVGNGWVVYYTINSEQRHRCDNLSRLSYVATDHQTVVLLGTFAGEVILDEKYKDNPTIRKKTIEIFESWIMDKSLIDQAQLYLDMLEAAE